MEATYRWFICVHSWSGIQNAAMHHCANFLPASFFVPGLSEMVTETASSPGPFRNAQMSKAAQTHKLRKLRAPSKCRECDSLVVFHGAECEEVSLFTQKSLSFAIG